jgi:hypothetical protein
MRVAANRSAGLKLRDSGHGLVTGHRQVALLEHRAFEAALLGADGAGADDASKNDRCDGEAP